MKAIVLYFMLSVFGMPLSPAKAEEVITIYFYNSEANINNFIPLVAGFDAFLSRSGSYRFQPFKERKTFEEEIRGKEKYLVLLSSLHYSEIHKKYNLRPLLVGVRNGRTYQKRILVCLNDVKEINSGQVASAGDQGYTMTLLREMLPDKESAESFRILTVPKEIDALMSVGFKVSKSALITEHTLDTVKKTDPSLCSKLKILAEGKESMLPILAVPEKFAGGAETLIKIIKSMPAQGTDIIKMLDLDDWKAVEPSDYSKLEG
jgi:hypothetical protein